MSANEYKSLNTDFVCFKQDREVYSPIDEVYNENKFKQDLNRGLVSELAKGGGLSQFNILKNSKYAKFVYLNLLGRYYSGDFMPKTEDKDFKIEINRVWTEIVTKWFFSSVWIGYGDEYLEAEKAAVFRSRGDWYDPSNFPFSKLRLYIMEDARTSEQNPFPTFRSIWTNIGGFKFDPYKLVYASCNGTQNFMYCWGVLDDYLGAQEAYINTFYASLKCVKVEVENGNQLEKELYEYQNSKNAVMILNKILGNEGENEWEEFPCPDPKNCGTIMGNILTYVDERMRWLGCYGKVLNQTKERTGVGEAWIDHKWVNNVREVHKMLLETLIEELKRIYPSIPRDLKLVPTTQEPHMDDRFKNMQNWKGDNNSFGNHWNSVKGLEKDFDKS